MKRLLIAAAVLLSMAPAVANAASDYLPQSSGGVPHPTVDLGGYNIPVAPAPTVADANVQCASRPMFRALQEGFRSWANNQERQYKFVEVVPGAPNMSVRPNTYVCNVEIKEKAAYVNQWYTIMAVETLHINPTTHRLWIKMQGPGIN
jgi:hypothetical protein